MSKGKTYDETLKKTIVELYEKGKSVNVNTKMYKKGNLIMYKKRNEIAH